MKAVYIPVGAAGHVLASLPMVAQLVRRGVEVAYFAPERFRAQVENTGARFCPMPAVAAKGPSVDVGRDFLAGLPLVFLGEAEGVVGGILPEIERFAPDVVIADEMALAGRIAAARLRAPLVMVFTSYAPCEKFSICRSWPTYPDAHPARAAAKEMAERLAARYGVPAWDVYGIFEETGAFNVSTLSRELQPEGDCFGENFCFAGAQIAKRPEDGSWRRRSAKKLLYTSLGSLFNNWPEFYAMLFPIVREMDIEVLCSVGRAIDPDTLGEIPENVTLMPFVPQLEVLQSADYFLTHAGTGSAMEALHFGVPCLCLPQMDEQRLTAERLFALGVAPAPLERATLTKERLRKGLSELMGNPEYAQNAKRISAKLRERDGAETAAAAIVEFMKKRSEKQRKFCFRKNERRNRV